MEAYLIITVVGTLFYLIKKTGFLPYGNFPPTLDSTTRKEKISTLSHKNIRTTGHFFPTSEEVFNNKLLQLNANVQPQMNEETDALICGKYPDWMLIEEAKTMGIPIIFVDNTAELFSRFGLSNDEQHSNTQVFIGV